MRKKNVWRYVLLLCSMTLSPFAGRAEEDTPVGVSSITANEIYYLYNVRTGKWLNKGEAYGTQAAASGKGMPVKLWQGTGRTDYVLYNVNDDKDLFRHSSDPVLGGPGVFCDGVNKGDAQKCWAIAPVEGKTGVFVIRVPEGADYADFQPAEERMVWAFGYAPGKAGYTAGFYYDAPYDAANDNCHWKFVTAEEYADFVRPDIPEGGTLNTPVDVTKATGVADYKGLSNNTNPIPGWTSRLSGEKNVTDKKFDSWNSHNGDMPEGLAMPVVEIWSGAAYSGTYLRDWEALPTGYYTLKMQAVGYDKNQRDGHDGISVVAGAAKASVAGGCNAVSYYEVTALVTDGTLSVGLEVAAGSDINWLYWSDPTLAYAAPKYEVNLGAIGYATVCLPFDADLPDGVAAYGVTGADADGTLQLEQSAKIEAGKPVLLCGSGKYTLEYDGKGAIEEVFAKGTLDGGSWMRGSYEKTFAPVGSYVLQKQDDVVAFYKVAEGKQPAVGAFKAWIEVPAAPIQANMLRFSLDGVTRVEDVGCSGDGVQDVDVYTLAGVKVKQGVKAADALKGLPKGIYVVDGKKVAVR